MPQFFIREGNEREGRCIIDGNDRDHLARVRRAREGDILGVRLPDGTPARARIVEVGERSIIAEIIDKKASEIIPLNLTLCAAILKGKRFETALQKAVEIGVSRIIPVISERTVPEIERKESDRLERWNRIAREAAKQCMRGDVPPVERAARIGDVLGRGFPDLRIIAHTERSGRAPRDFLCDAASFNDIAVLVGPEGGFSPREIERARENGWSELNFGFTQMRAETAAVVVPAILLYEWSHQYEDHREL